MPRKTRARSGRKRIFVALPSDILESAFREVESEYRALIEALRGEGFDVVCPQEQAGWTRMKEDEPQLAMEQRLRDLENSDHVLTLPKVKKFESPGVMGYTFWAVAKGKPTTAYLCGPSKAYDFDVPWQLVGFRDSQHYSLDIVTYTRNLSDGFEELAQKLDGICRDEAPHQQSSDEECPFGPQYAKYWQMRYELFSKWDEGIQVDDYGLCSVKPEQIAREIARKLQGDTVLDACCGVGGTAIAFASMGKRVLAVDSSAERVAMARHNTVIYGVQDRIEFHVGDIANLWPKLAPRCQAVYLDPSWGGPGYDRANRFGFDDFEFVGKGTARQLIEHIVGDRKALAITLPRNFDSQQLWELHRSLAATVPDGGHQESRQIHLIWHLLGRRLLFMTAFLDAPSPPATDDQPPAS